jgi:dihydrofolate reductase
LGCCGRVTPEDQDHGCPGIGPPLIEGAGDVGRIIEYTLVSSDGVYSDPAGLGFMRFRDDAYLRDGLGVLCASEAMIMGRRFYESSARMWQSRPGHPWASRLNTMRKYVFSSTLKAAEWDNCVILSGNVITEAAALKEKTSGDLLIWGHTRLAETLMRHGLVDLIDLSIHPMLVGSGDLFFRDGLGIPLRLVSAKCFSQIVKLTYQVQYTTPATRPGDRRGPRP